VNAAVSWRVGAVLLAAGAARRFGSDKRAARLPDGSTVLEAALRPLLCCCDEILVVTAAADGDVALPGHPGAARIVRSPRSGGGMGCSLADGIAQAVGWDACMVSLADKPFIRENSVRRVRALLENHEIVVPTHRGEWGHPVGFARRYFAALGRLAGDAGARSLILAERERVRFVELDDPGILADVDTPDQLARYAAQFSCSLSGAPLHGDAEAGADPQAVKAAR